MALEQAYRSKSHCLAALILALTVLRSPVAHCKDTSDDFVLESKGECHYSNGGRDVRFLVRYLYNAEEFVYFDSAVGSFIAKTEFGKPSADYWNKDTEFLEQRRAEVERFCKHNYGVWEPYTADRRVKPNVKVSPMKAEEAHEHHKLACYVTGFYPSAITVKWYRNQVEETSSVVSTELLQNGDWTFQILVILETTLQHGVTYTCEVEHSSLQEPLKVDWEPETSESEKSKMLTGIVGFVLGAVFIVVGLIIYLKNKKGSTPLQIPVNEGLLS